MRGGIKTLDGIDDAMEALLEAIALPSATHNSKATGLQLLDRLEQLTHLGVRVDYPDTDNQRRTPDNAAHGAWADDRVNVVLAYQLRNAGQRESRRLAWQIERLIILAVTGASALQANHPRYDRSRRRTPQSGWYEITTTFLLSRPVEVA